MKQRAFARTRCADDGKTFSSRHLEINVAQHVQRILPLAEGLAQIFADQHGRVDVIIHNAAPPPAARAKRANWDTRLQSASARRTRKRWSPHRTATLWKAIP